MPEREHQPASVGNGTARLRTIVALAGAVYLAWWFMVELLLPGSFNPLPGRLAVVAADWLLLAASYRSAWVQRYLSALFTAWACLLVVHYCYLIVGNDGETTWWVGTFVTFAAVSMCMQSWREVALFSLFSLACVVGVAAAEGQLAHSIYVPGLATILLLANVTKRSQAIAHDAMLKAEDARNASRKADEQRFLEVSQAREAAEAANRELEAFSYSVAHDLRAPLRSIDGFSNALLEDHGSTLAPVAHDYLERIQRNAKLMGQLIDALLELGRITRTDISVQRVDLSELARATAERLKEFEPERAVEFVIDDGLAEQGDSALLGAVIENLFSNAWKFTRNRKNARIEFGSRRESGKTIYFVRDNGAGFNMESASKLFRVFQRLHSQDEFAGNGVGLATVHRILQRHGGRIWAEGKIGEGASFHFTLDRR
jgi:signal transduction histidine kinase